jgi:hypothetical protein
MADLTPQQRIELAEAEEVEAMRDILRAEARAAAAEAEIMENLVAFDLAMNNALMGISGQGPLPSASPATFFLELVKVVGKEAAMELLEMGKDYVLDKLRELIGRQNGSAERMRAAADKEEVIKNGKRTGFLPDPSRRIPTGAPAGNSDIAPVSGSSVALP